jgi:DNA-binding MarR family transcriptional regulator
MGNAWVIQPSDPATIVDVSNPAPAVDHSRSGDDAVDGELSMLLLEFMEQLKDAAQEAAHRLDLTLPQAMVLRAAETPVPMRLLADELSYDASSITAIVDRLEVRGLVERRPDPDDRRVRLILVTHSGLETRRRLETSLFAEVPGIRDLDAATRSTLVEVLRRMLCPADG